MFGNVDLNLCTVVAEKTHKQSNIKKANYNATLHPQKISHMSEMLIPVHYFESNTKHEGNTAPDNQTPSPDTENIPTIGGWTLHRGIGLNNSDYSTNFFLSFFLFFFSFFETGLFTEELA